MQKQNSTGLSFWDIALYVVSIIAGVLLIISVGKVKSLRSENEVLTSKVNCLTSDKYIDSLLRENATYKLYKKMDSTAIEYAVSEYNLRDNTIDSLIRVITDLEYELKKPKQ